MSNLRSNWLKPPQFIALLWLIMVWPLAAEDRKEYRYSVESEPMITVSNSCGSIAVGPSGSKEIIVTTIAYSEGVTFVHEQHGRRLEFQARSKHQEKVVASYQVLVPSDAFVIMRSSYGTLHAEGLRGDIVLEGPAAAIEVTGMSNAHVHVKTLTGAVGVTNVRSSRVDIQSVSGNIRLHNVTASTVQANSESGTIMYEGDPDGRGEYHLTTRTGAVFLSIPAKAPVEIKTLSLNRGFDEQDQAIDRGLQTGQSSLLSKKGAVNWSKFVVRSFGGRIHITRP